MKCLQFLKKKEGGELAGRIKSSVTFEWILGDIRKSITTTKSVNCFHAVQKHNLHNIMRGYDLDRDIVYKNDVFSMEIWVQVQMFLSEVTNNIF